MQEFAWRAWAATWSRSEYPLRAPSRLENLDRAAYLSGGQMEDEARLASTERTRNGKEHDLSLVR